jgi:hypothetical protein
MWRALELQRVVDPHHIILFGIVTSASIFFFAHLALAAALILAIVAAERLPLRPSLAAGVDFSFASGCVPSPNISLREA